YDQAKADAVSDVFKRIPRRGRHTLELDNGNEFARFGESEKTGPSEYFADTDPTWQSGDNENANDLVRRYVPNGDEFSKITEKIAAVVWEINHRPRKCLGYRSPHQVFQEARR
uniref:IS30 family transposase n=1 Tax=Zoogloea sp. TaxID=49181 RepID=UPI0032203844